MDEESAAKQAWNSAAAEYSEIVREQLSSSDKEYWMNLIYEYAPKKQKLKVLDIGTGPGFFPIALSMDGHEAVGVDLSVGMLKEAEQNAKDFGVRCTFLLMNANSLMFDSDQFDLIINRNVTWTLPDMMECYKEWKRVLAPGGRLLVLDSNFNWNLFDEEHDRVFRELVREMRILGVDSGSVNSGFMFRSSYMETRPMLGMPRPQWDRNMLIKLRFTNIITKTEVLVGSPLDRMPNPEAAAPLFLISAEKPSAEEDRRLLIKEYWDGLAPFDSGTCHRICSDGRAVDYYRSLGEFIPAGKVLDLACGAGFLTIAGRLLGYDIVGMDSSEQMMKEAERCSAEAGVPSDFVLADAHSMPFEDGSFRCVIIRNSLWAFDDPGKVLEESRRVLSDGGILMIIDAEWIPKLLENRPEVNDDGVRIRSGETGFGGTDLIDPIFCALPLSSRRRPLWDDYVCESLGFKAIHQGEFDDKLVDRSIHRIVGDSFIRVMRKYRSVMSPDS